MDLGPNILFAQRHKPIGNAGSENHSGAEDSVSASAEQNWNDAHAAIKGRFLPISAGLGKLRNSLDKVNKCTAERGLESDRKKTGGT